MRHNEELLNAKLAMEVPWKCEEARLGDPHEKAFLLVQAHFAGLPLPIADYANDTRSVLDQVPRVLNAMVDVAADKGLLDTALAAMQLSQLLAQGAFPEHSTLLQLPHIGEEAVAALARAVRCLLPAPGSSCATTPPFVP